jgi:hypothetical protein
VQWVQDLGLDGGTTRIGVPDKQAFCAAGYSSDYNVTPGTIRAQISELKGRQPNLTSGFIWQYANVLKDGGTYTGADFAAAIIQGLENPRDN